MQALTEKIVFFKVNGWEDTVMTKQWGVSGYPSMILLNSDGTEIDRIPGYAPPEEFIQTMEDYAAGRNTLKDYLSRYEANPDSLSLIMEIGQKYQSISENSMAVQYYNELVAADPDNASELADNAMHSIARMKYGEGADSYDEAIVLFTALAETFPDGDVTEDGETYIPYILARQEKYEEAMAMYQKFLTDHPESSEVDWVNARIAELQEKGF